MAALFVDDAAISDFGSVEDQDLGLESTWPLASQGLGCHGISARQHGRSAHLLGSDRRAAGQFDFSSIDRLLAAARQHRVRLILLWFATWKNGSQHYMPEWMLSDPARYFHAVNRNGEAVDSPSPFATASLEADKKAFAAVMGHLKKPIRSAPSSWFRWRMNRQLEERPRFLAGRAEVLRGAGAARDPQGHACADASASPNWQGAFGPNADEYFNAWAVAKYVGEVAAAGKAVYPLPMDVNDALRNPFHPGLPENRALPAPTRAAAPPTM
jgi:hypothetical protein